MKTLTLSDYRFIQGYLTKDIKSLIDKTESFLQVFEMKASGLVEVWECENNRILLEPIQKNDQIGDIISKKELDIFIYSANKERIQIGYDGTIYEIYFNKCHYIR